MKLTKQIIISVLIIICGFSFGGCRIFESYTKNLKDIVLEAMDNAMQSFSKNVLTRNYRLTGSKKEGATPYEGVYGADYDDFSGKEALFGSTSLNLDANMKLEIDYDIDSEAGDGCLFRVSPDGIVIIAEDGSGTVNFGVEPGDNYIIFQGDHFSGSLNLKCRFAG